MTADDLRALDAEDLDAKVAALEEEFFTIKFQHATAQLSDTSKVRKARRTLARAKTILTEKRRAHATPQAEA